VLPIEFFAAALVPAQGSLTQVTVALAGDTDGTARPVTLEIITSAVSATTKRNLRF
jgi:hypothetical protein